MTRLNPLRGSRSTSRRRSSSASRVSTTRRSAAGHSRRSGAGIRPPLAIASTHTSSRAACGSASSSRLALVLRPKLLIADEPTTSLDVIVEAQILSILADLRTNFGTALLLITHNLGIVAEACDGVAVMYREDRGGGAGPGRFRKPPIRTRPSCCARPSRSTRRSCTRSPAQPPNLIDPPPDAASTAVPTRDAGVSREGSTRADPRGRAPRGVLAPRPRGRGARGRHCPSRRRRSEWRMRLDAIENRASSPCATSRRTTRSAAGSRRSARTREATSGRSTTSRSICAAARSWGSWASPEAADNAGTDDSRLAKATCRQRRVRRQRDHGNVRATAPAVRRRMRSSSRIPIVARPGDDGQAVRRASAEDPQLASGNEYRQRSPECSRRSGSRRRAVHGQVPVGSLRRAEARAAIARAIVMNPLLLVADEPVSMLDMSVRAKILQLMLDLKREFGLTYLYITHDLATAKFFCDRIAIIYLGRMVEIGPAKAIYEDPKHPYTKALLAAIPEPDPRRSVPRDLPRGEVPDAARPPLGCSFHPRCPPRSRSAAGSARDLGDLLEARWALEHQDEYEAERGLIENLGASRRRASRSISERGTGADRTSSSFSSRRVRATRPSPSGVACGSSTPSTRAWRSLARPGHASRHRCGRRQRRVPPLRRGGACAKRRAGGASAPRKRLRPRPASRPRRLSARSQLGREAGEVSESL